MHLTGSAGRAYAKDATRQDTRIVAGGNAALHSARTLTVDSEKTPPSGAPGTRPVRGRYAAGYGTNVGLVDGSHTSLLVATSCFMLLQVRRPGIDGDPSTTARA